MIINPLCEERGKLISKSYVWTGNGIRVIKLISISMECLKLASARTNFAYAKNISGIYLLLYMSLVLQRIAKVLVWFIFHNIYVHIDFGMRRIGRAYVVKTWLSTYLISYPIWMFNTKIMCIPSQGRAGDHWHFSSPRGIDIHWRDNEPQTHNLGLHHKGLH